MDVSERYEQLIAYLNSNLPAPGIKDMTRPKPAQHVVCSPAHRSGAPPDGLPAAG